MKLWANLVTYDLRFPIISFLEFSNALKKSDKLFKSSWLSDWVNKDLICYKNVLIGKIWCFSWLYILQMGQIRPRWLHVESTHTKFITYPAWSPPLGQCTYLREYFFIDSFKDIGLDWLLKYIQKIWICLKLYQIYD